MPSRRDRRYRLITPFQKHVYNRIASRLAMQPVLELLPKLPGLAVRAVGTDLLTVCVSLDASA